MSHGASSVKQYIRFSLTVQRQFLKTIHKLSKRSINVNTN